MRDDVVWGQKKINNGNMMTNLDIPASITEDQMIKVSRHSDRIQEKIVQEVQTKISKKRDLEGTNLDDPNSFSILDNSSISMLANNMGILIDECDFDVVDIMKDLELARHKLDNKGKNLETVKANNNHDDVCRENNMVNRDRLLIEWNDNEDLNSETNDMKYDGFTMVTSRKKQRKKVEIPLENLRSKRTTPSEYRGKGKQESPVPKLLNKNKQKVNKL